MVKSPTKAAPKARTRAVHPPYDQAVRATLKGGERAEIEALLKGAKNMRAEYGSFDALIAKLEAAVSKS